MSDEEKGIWSLSKPTIMIDAAEENSSYNFIVELLKYLAVWFISFKLLVIVIQMLLPVFIKKSPGPMFEMLFPFVVLGMSRVVCILCYRLIERTKIRNMGFVKRGALKEYLLGALCGLLCFSVVIGTSTLLGGTKFEGVSLAGDNLLMVIIIFPFFLIQSAGEEIAFRGYFLSTFSRRHNLWLSDVL